MTFLTDDSGEFTATTDWLTLVLKEDEYALYNGEINLSSLLAEHVVEIEILNKETRDGDWQRLILEEHTGIIDVNDPKYRIAGKEEVYGFWVRIRLTSGADVRLSRMFYQNLL